MSILNVRHQRAAHLLLQSAFAGQRLPHAYVFHGPDGVGKQALARHFGQLLVCPSPAATTTSPEEYADLASNWKQACGTCRSCLLAAAGTHPDCITIHRYLNQFHPDTAVRQRKALDLGVDVVRQFLIEVAGRTPALGHNRVFVIQECERLTASAQNALLKILEEPPNGCYVILLASHIDHLLATTRSRCQAIAFGLLPPDFVLVRLRELRPEASEDERQFFAYHVSGSLGAALELLDAGFFECNQRVVQQVLTLRRDHALDLAGLLEELGKQMSPAVRHMIQGRMPQVSAESKKSEISDSDANRQALRCLLGLLGTCFRDLLTLACGAQTPLCNRGHRSELQRLAEAQTADRLRQAIRVTSDAATHIDLNANLRLTLDRLGIELARLCGPAAIPARTAMK